MKKNLEFAKVFITVEETCVDVTIYFKNSTTVEMKIDIEKFNSFKINYEFDEYADAIMYGYELPEDFLEYVLKFGDRFDDFGRKVSCFDAKKNRRIRLLPIRKLGGRVKLSKHQLGDNPDIIIL